MLMLKKMLTAGAVAGAVAAIGAGAAQAGQIILTPSNVIGSSGSYASNSPRWAPGGILNQQTGSVFDSSTDSFGLPVNNFWLGEYQSPAYITIDLGADYSVASIQLFNTTNDGGGDRGTGSFLIYGSDTTAYDPIYNSTTLGGTPTLLLSSTLAAAPIGPYPNYISGQTFSLTTPQTVRYLQFQPTNCAGANPCAFVDGNGHSVAYGLNEVRVFSTASVSDVPEPATWAMMLVGFGGLGVALRSRRRTATAAA